MKKLSLSIVTALMFFVATAMAQTTPQSTPQTDPQGSTTASPSSASPSSQTSTPSTQTPAEQPGSATSSTGMQSGSTAADTKGEKKLKGCIESENGKYVLENKHGKEVTLTGQDLSGHVGHQVVVHGNFQNNAAASASGENAGTAASAGSTSTSSTSASTTTGSSDTKDMKAKAGKDFNVTSVDMVSSTCKDKDEKTEKHSDTSAPPQKY